MHAKNQVAIKGEATQQEMNNIMVRLHKILVIVKSLFQRVIYNITGR